MTTSVSVDPSPSAPMRRHGSLERLPGSDLAVRMDGAAWDWALAVALRGTGAPEVEDPIPTPGWDLLMELANAGMLRTDVTDADVDDLGQLLDPSWAETIRAARTEGILLSFTCIDARSAWVTEIAVIGADVLVTDRPQGVQSDEDGIQLLTGSSPVTVALSTVEEMGRLLRSVLPQWPAFGVAATGRWEVVDGPSSTRPLDSPAVAEVHLVTTCADPSDGELHALARHWYALGVEGEALVSVAGEADEPQLVPSSATELMATIQADLASAITFLASRAGDR